MAIVTTDEKHYKAIADAIRAENMSDDTFSPDEMPQAVSDACDFCRTKGKEEEYDRMWDRLQKDGSTDYKNVNGHFNGGIFSFRNFYPKYDIRPVGDARYLFYGWSDHKDHAGDFKRRLDECGVVLDTSGATDLSSAFAYSSVDNLPTIDFTGLTAASTHVFNYADGIITIEKIIVKESVTFSNWFTNAFLLTNVTFEGVIGPDINFNHSPLSIASMKSVISCLKNYAGTDKQDTCTVKFHEDCWAALEADSTAPDGGTWREYVTSLGWLN